MTTRLYQVLSTYHACSYFTSAGTTLLYILGFLVNLIFALIDPSKKLVAILAKEILLELRNRSQRPSQLSEYQESVNHPDLTWKFANGKETLFYRLNRLKKP